MDQNLRPQTAAETLVSCSLSQPHIQGANKQRAALEVQSPAVSIRDLLRTSASAQNTCSCPKNHTPGSRLVPQPQQLGQHCSHLLPEHIPWGWIPGNAQFSATELQTRQEGGLGWEHRAEGPLCGTALLRAAAAPCKPSLQKTLTLNCCISLSVLEDQSQPWLVAGAASSAPPAPKFVGFELCYCTQACRCILVIFSCKGQQVRPRAALSSFALLLSFWVAPGAGGMGTATKPCKAPQLEPHQLPKKQGGFLGGG